MADIAAQTEAPSTSNGKQINYAIDSCRLDQAFHSCIHS